MGAADAVRDQEGPHLGVIGLALEHQVHRHTGLLPIQAGAGVFAAAHLADQLAEVGPLGAERPQADKAPIPRGVGPQAGRFW